MKRPVSLAFAVLMLAGSFMMWFNGSTVTDWLAEQRIIIEEGEEEALLGLQSNEHWLVVVVDFPDHPASDAWGPVEAQTLLEQAAKPYIDQISGGASTLTLEVHPTVVRASSNLAAYGSDGSGKDTNADGKFLPAALAQEVVEQLESTLAWADADLDGDGQVDRLLLLHSTKGQEESSGVQERIWSHFTTFEDPLEVENGLTVSHYTMASLQTGSSGVGTILHEMLHQMGAVDLYPVHDEGSFQAWKGPGDWDIMASGNWNGGGRWPALPSGATLDLIGAPQLQPVELEWPPSAVKPCIGPTVALTGLSETGNVLKIQISEQEYVYIEHRSDSGFDERLPGHGVLVTYQDLSVGDIESNELNTNPNLPWLMVIEADQGNELMSGANQGEASDLFQNNTSFGASGVQIRTHDGLLVPWTARVMLNNQSATLTFEADGCSPHFDLDLPDHGATVLFDQPVTLSMTTLSTTCSSNLTSSDGRGVTFISNGDDSTLQFTSSGTPNSIVRIVGSVTCDGKSVDLDYSVRILNRIPVITSFTDSVHPTEETTLGFPLDSTGEGNQILSVALTGPLARVATTPETVDIAAGSIDLSIEPNGLLVENMLIRGEIVLSTTEGLSWTLPVELVAESSEEGWRMYLPEPHHVLAALLLLMSFSMIGTQLRSEASSVQSVPSIQPQTPLKVELDAWGRPLDVPASSVAMDVQVRDEP